MLSGVIARVVRRDGSDLDGIPRSRVVGSVDGAYLVPTVVYLSTDGRGGPETPSVSGRGCHKYCSPVTLLPSHRPGSPQDPIS